MLGSSLLSGLASQTPANSNGGQPGSPDNPRAAAALAAMILAGHAFLRSERDPQDRAAVTACLAKLESMRGKKMPGASQGVSQGPPQGPGQNMANSQGPSGGNPGGNIPGY